MNNKLKKIGAFPGKFLPPHLGHINTILDCAKKCDELLVIVADSEKRTEKICLSCGGERKYTRTNYG